MQKALVFWLGVATVAGGVLFHTSYRVQSLEERLSSINRQIITEQETIQVYNAEWGILNAPARLERLASEHLQLKPTGVAQLSGYESIPMRPPESGAVVDAGAVPGSAPVTTPVSAPVAAPVAAMPVVAAVSAPARPASAAPSRAAPAPRAASLPARPAPRAVATADAASLARAAGLRPVAGAVAVSMAGDRARTAPAKPVADPRKRVDEIGLLLARIKVN